MAMRKASLAFPNDERPSKIKKRTSRTTVSTSALLPNDNGSLTTPVLRRASTLTLEDDDEAYSAYTSKTERKSSMSKPSSLFKKSGSFVEKGALVTKLSGLSSGSIVGETSLASMPSQAKTPSRIKSLSRKSSSVKSTDSSSSRIPSLPSGLTKLALPAGGTKSGSLRVSVSTLVSDIDETEMSSALESLKTSLSKEGSKKGSMSKSSSVRSRSSLVKLPSTNHDAENTDTSIASTSTDIGSPALPSSGDLMEVAISFDTTGSMYSCLEEVKTKVQDLVQRLQTDIPGIRVAIIAHGDYCDEHNYVVKWIDFGASLPELCDFVQNVGQTSGGDSPECYELVLQRSREALSWTEGSKRVLVMIGDNVPHEPGYTYGGKTYHINWRDECAALKEMDVKIYAVQAVSLLMNFSATFFYEEMARLTGGKSLQLTNFNCLFDIIMMICYREGNPEMLAVYEQEIIDRGEKMANDITSLKNTFDSHPMDNLSPLSPIGLPPPTSMPVGTEGFDKLAKSKQLFPSPHMLSSSPMGLPTPSSIPLGSHAFRNVPTGKQLFSPPHITPSTMTLGSGLFGKLAKGKQPKTKLPKNKKIAANKCRKPVKARIETKAGKKKKKQAGKTNDLTTGNQFFPSSQMMMSSPMGLQPPHSIPLGTHAFSNVASGKQLFSSPHMTFGLPPPPSMTLGSGLFGKVTEDKEPKTKLPKNKNVAANKSRKPVKASIETKAGKKKKKQAGKTNELTTGNQLFSSSHMMMSSPLGLPPPHSIPLGTNAISNLASGKQLFSSPHMTFGLPQPPTMTLGSGLFGRVSKDKEPKTKLPKNKNVAANKSRKPVKASIETKAGKKKKKQAGKTNELTARNQLFLSSHMMMSSPMGLPPPHSIPLGTHAFSNVTAGNQLFPSSHMMMSSPMGLPPPHSIPLGTNALSNVTSGKQLFSSPHMTFGLPPQPNMTPGSSLFGKVAEDKEPKTKLPKNKKVAATKSRKPVKASIETKAGIKKKKQAGKTNELTAGNQLFPSSHMMMSSPMGLPPPHSIPLGTNTFSNVTSGKQLFSSPHMTFGLPPPPNMTLGSGLFGKVAEDKEPKTKLSKNKKAAANKIRKPVKASIETKAGKKKKKQAEKTNNLATGIQPFPSSHMMMSSPMGLPTPSPIPPPNMTLPLPMGLALPSSLPLRTSGFGMVKKGKQTKKKLPKVKKVVAKSKGKPGKVSKETKAKKKTKKQAVKTNEVTTGQLFPSSHMMLSSPMGFSQPSTMSLGTDGVGKVAAGKQRFQPPQVMLSSPTAFVPPSTMSFSNDGFGKMTKGKQPKQKLPKAKKVAVKDTGKHVRASKEKKAMKETKKQARKTNEVTTSKQRLPPSHLMLSSHAGLQLASHMLLGTDGFGKVAKGKQPKNKLQKAKKVAVKSARKPVKARKETNNKKKTKKQAGKTNEVATGKQLFPTLHMMPPSSMGLQYTTTLSNVTGGFRKVGTDKNFLPPPHMMNSSPMGLPPQPTKQLGTDGFGKVTTGKQLFSPHYMMLSSPMGYAVPSPFSLGTNSFGKVATSKQPKTKLLKTKRVAVNKTETPVKGSKKTKAGGKAKNQAGKTNKSREKLPDSCMSNGVLKTITWSKWVNCVEPKMPTNKNKSEFVKLRTNQGFGLKTLFDNDFECPAFFEVAVQLPGLRKKYIVYFRMTKRGFGRNGHWATNLLRDKDVRQEVNRVLDEGCSIFIRRGIPKSKKDGKYDAQMKAANDYITDNFDYAWKKYIWRRSESESSKFGLRHRLLKITRKGKVFILSDSTV